jgi:RND family efflux transporter MFP subunit
VEAVYASGNLKAENQYLVYSEVQGLISELPAAEGDLISQNQLLAVVENRSGMIKKKITEANLKEARENYLKTSPVLKQLDSEIETLILEVREDSTNSIRYQHLSEKGAVTKSESESRFLKWKSSSAKLQELQLKRIEVSNTLEKNYQNALNNDRLAMSDLESYTIRSLIQGKLYKYYKKKGDMVSLKDPIALVGAPNNFWIELTVDESDIRLVKKGQKVLVKLDALPDSIYEARVDNIIPLLDESTKTFKVEARFWNLPTGLYPGLTAEANIVIREKKDALAIPRSYLLAGDSVWISEEKKQKVQVGIRTVEYAEIIGGLTPQSILFKK